MQAIAALLHMSVGTMLLLGSVMLSLLSVYFLIIALRMILDKLSHIVQRNELAKGLIFCLTAAVLTVILAQTMVSIRPLSMGSLNFAFGVLIVLTVIGFIYCMLGRLIPSVLLGAGIFMLISTVNVYIYQFRGRSFEPVDILSVGTAMNVAENYSLLPIPVAIIFAWAAFAGLAVFLSCLSNGANAKPTARIRCIILGVCVISTAAITLFSTNLTTYHWHLQGAQYNGYVLDFVSKFKEMSVSRPDDYSDELIDELASRYTESSDTGKAASSELPHIIVIMDESFSDLSVAGEFTTNTEVAPFISSLRENTVCGFALSSVYGGNTANSEYEFLTGNSMAWLSPNTVPYQQYIRSSAYSMVSYLKLQYDYRCIAMHPFEASGWNRPVAYGHLGFDECYFVEDFPQADYIREYVSDREMFEFLIDTYESKKEEPLFIFGVTMQNHGGYTYSGDNYTRHISLPDHDGEFPEVEQYLSLIHETDKAVEYLITYFRNVDEDVVIVFFGDHQPRIGDAFYETIGNFAHDSPDERQKRYIIPFFIWANYDIEEAYIDCTSLNYLSSYVYDTAGIDLPPYNRFLRELEDMIPAINANGFYSLSSGRFLSFDEADTEEEKWLEQYEILQYNSIFDEQGRNGALFPVLGQ